jgi:ankyrin repeat protein
MILNHPHPKRLQAVPLCCVSELGFLGMTRHLLSKCPQGVNIRFGTDKEFFTLLHTAVDFRRVEFIKLLQEYGADMEIRGLSNRTPLHVASRGGHVDIVRLLLDHGTGENDRRIKGTTLLRRITSLRRVTFARIPFLRSTGVHARDFDGWTPLHHASWAGRHEVMQLLLDRGADVDAHDISRQTPLHSTLDHRFGWEGADKTVCMLLLESGAKVNVQDSKGRTPLHSAIKRGHYNIIQLLLDRGAGVDAQDKYGYTPLHMVPRRLDFWDFDACIAESKTACMLLLDSGANVNRRDRNGQTPLHLAAIHGDCAVVELLLDQGAADVDAQDKQHSTALHHACSLSTFYGEVDLMKPMCELLLASGANVHVRNKDRKTPYQLALIGGVPDSEVIQLLSDHTGSKQK